MRKSNVKGFYGLLIFSLVLLFNPNVNVIDPLPDFIAWFILAKLFERAADSAPYFEEARADFVKLAWINFFKIPALMLIIFIRGKNFGDNDIYALVSFVFAVLETLLVIRATKNIFTALFYVGERTSASSLITPFQYPVCKSRLMSPDLLRGFTYFFVVCKSILYTLPDMFLLTRISKTTGQIMTISKYYPFVLVFSQILGITVGAIWLSRVIKYAKAVKDEGEFENALISLRSNESAVKFSAKSKIRSLCFALTLISVSSFFMLELAFDNFNRIDILPNFIFGIFLTIAIYIFKNGIESDKTAILSGIAFISVSLASYIVSARFLSVYNYTDLLTETSAQKFYIWVQILSVAEFLFHTAFLVLSVRALNRFIKSNTGIVGFDGDSSKLDKQFHNELFKKSYIFAGLGIASSLAKCVNVILNRYVKVIYTDIADTQIPTITSSPLPWFNIVVTACAVLFIGYTLYYTSTLKDEVRLKYENE